MTRKELNRKYWERTCQMHALRMKGMTLEAIGERYGVTRERVRQCLAKYDRRCKASLTRDFFTILESRGVIIPHGLQFQIAMDLDNIFNKFLEGYYNETIQKSSTDGRDGAGDCS